MKAKKLLTAVAGIGMVAAGFSIGVPGAFAAIGSGRTDAPIEHLPATDTPVDNSGNVKETNVFPIVSGSGAANCNGGDACVEDIGDTVTVKWQVQVTPLGYYISDNLNRDTGRVGGAWIAVPKVVENVELKTVALPKSIDEVDGYNTVDGVNQVPVTKVSEPVKLVEPQKIDGTLDLEFAEINNSSHTTDKYENFETYKAIYLSSFTPDDYSTPSLGRDSSLWSAYFYTDPTLAYLHGENGGIVTQEITGCPDENRFYVDNNGIKHDESLCYYFGTGFHLPLVNISQKYVPDEMQYQTGGGITEYGLYPESSADFNFIDLGFVDPGVSTFEVSGTVKVESADTYLPVRVGAARYSCYSSSCSYLDSSPGYTTVSTESTVDFPEYSLTDPEVNARVAKLQSANGRLGSAVCSPTSETNRLDMIGIDNLQAPLHDGYLTLGERVSLSYLSNSYEDYNRNAGAFDVVEDGCDQADFHITLCDEPDDTPENPDTPTPEEPNTPDKPSTGEPETPSTEKPTPTPSVKPVSNRVTASSQPGVVLADTGAHVAGIGALAVLAVASGVVGVVCARKRSA